MSYNYQTERPFVFSPEGLEKVIAIRDCAKGMCKFSGGVGAQQLLNAGGSGSCWQTMACVDWLVERGDIKRVHDGGAWQAGIYIWTGPEL